MGIDLFGLEKENNFYNIVITRNFYFKSRNGAVFVNCVFENDCAEYIIDADKFINCIYEDGSVVECETHGIEIFF